MATLKNQRGQPLLDADGQEIKEGSVVVAPGCQQDAEGEEGEEGAALSRGIREVRWSVPDGFTVALEPSILDVSLVDSAVYMRWETYGWQMGKITGMVTSATPRLVKKFNYRIVWADGSKGPAKLQVDNYGHGSHARYNSWVILIPATGD